MATIKEVRSKYPQYSDLTDAQLADALHAKFYSDIPKSDFYERVGLETSALRDIGGALVRGVGQVAALPGQLYGLATGDFDNMSTRAGKTVDEFGAEIQTPAFRAQQEEAQQRVAAAEKEGGFLSGAGQQVREFFDSPLSVATGVAQTLPAMVGTGGAGLAGRALAGRLAMNRAAGAMAGAAAGSGALVAGDAGSTTYARVMAMPQETVEKAPAYVAAVSEGASPEEARQALAVSAARRAAAIAAPVAALISPLGIESAALTGGLARGVIGGTVRGAVGEGAQEFVEEGSQAVAENVGAQIADPTIPTMENVGGRATAGAVLGMGLGAPAGAVGGLTQQRQQSPGRPTPLQRPDGSTLVPVGDSSYDPRSATIININGVDYFVVPPNAPPGGEIIDVAPAPVGGPAVPPVGEPVVVDIDGAPFPVAGVTTDGDGQVVIEGVDGTIKTMPIDEWERIRAPVAEPVTVPEPVVAPTPEPAVSPVAEPAPEPVPEPINTPLSDADLAPITPEQYAKAETATREIASRVAGKTMTQVARDLAKNAELPTIRSIMGRTAGILESFERSGIELNIAVQEKARERALPGISLGIRTRGQMTGKKFEPSLSVVLKGPNLPNAGTSEATLAHELIHAVTMTSIDYRQKLPKDSRAYKAAEDLSALSSQIAKRMTADKKFDGKYRTYRSNPNEIIAWGLTDSEFQSYLKTIPTKTGNAFTDFVRYIGKLLGLAETDQNALTRLIEIADDLIPADAQGVTDVTTGAVGWAGLPGIGTDELSSAPDPGLVLPEDTRGQSLRRTFVDRLARLEQTEKLGEPQNRDRSAYEAARRMDSKAAARIADFSRKYFEPITKAMNAAKITLNEVDWFLYARAAEARNTRIENSQREAVIRAVSEETGEAFDPANPSDTFINAIAAAYESGKITESGSGLSTIEAREMLRDYSERETWPAYERIGNLFDAMHKERMELAVRNGLVSADTAKFLQGAEPNYAPMKGRSAGNEDLTIADQEFDPLMGYGGTGIAVSKNEWMKAMGRSSPPFSPLSYARSDAITSIVRGERNAVGQLLMDFLLKNPSNLWRVFGENNPPRDNQGRIIQITNQNPDFAIVKRGGKSFYLKIKDPLLIRAVKALDVQEMRPLLNTALFRIPAAFTRALARSFTSWNPEFFVVNYVRDIQSALLNIMSETDTPGGRAAGKEITKRFAKYATDRKQFRTIAGAEFGNDRLINDQATADLYRQFKLDGGSVGWISRENPQEIAAKVKQDFDDLMQAQQSIGPIRTRDDVRRVAGYYYRKTGRAGRAVIGALENANSVFENGIRFAAYRAALDGGLSRNQAAMLAREATVDFNRRGEASAAINGLYAFFNAGVQGATRTARALSNNPLKTRKLTRAQATVLGVMGTAAVLAAYNAATSAEDDDGELFYDKIPSYEKERSLIVMNPLDGKTYAKLPMPYGFGFFPALATRISDAIRKDEFDGIGVQTLNSLLQNFSPIQFNQGSSVFSSGVKALTPTLMKPVTDLMLNENFMGKPIYNEPFDKAQSLASAPRFSTPEAYKSAAMFLNEITGGEGKVKGAGDVPAEGLEYLFNFALGGAGTATRSVGRLMESGDPTDVPLARRFIGGPQAARNVGKYYERATEVQARLLEMRDKDTVEERRDFMRRNPVDTSPQVQAALSRVRKETRALNKQRRAIMDNDSMDEGDKTERLDEIKKRADASFIRFNTVYNQVEQRQEQ